MTKKQIIILVVLACAVFCVLCFGGYIVISSEQAIALPTAIPKPTKSPTPKPPRDRPKDDLSEELGDRLRSFQVQSGIVYVEFMIDDALSREHFKEGANDDIQFILQTVDKSSVGYDAVEIKGVYPKEGAVWPFEDDDLMTLLLLHYSKAKIQELNLSQKRYTNIWNAAHPDTLEISKWVHWMFRE